MVKSAIARPHSIKTRRICCSPVLIVRGADVRAVPNAALSQLSEPPGLPLVALGSDFSNEPVEEHPVRTSHLAG